MMREDGTRSFPTGKPLVLAAHSWASAWPGEEPRSGSWEWVVTIPKRPRWQAERIKRRYHRRRRLLELREQRRAEKMLS